MIKDVEDDNDEIRFEDLPKGLTEDSFSADLTIVFVGNKPRYLRVWDGYAFTEINLETLRPYINWESTEVLKLFYEFLLYNINNEPIYEYEKGDHLDQVDEDGNPQIYSPWDIWGVPKSEGNYDDCIRDGCRWGMETVRRELALESKRILEKIGLSVDDLRSITNKKSGE